MGLKPPYISLRDSRASHIPRREPDQSDPPRQHSRPVVGKRRYSLNRKNREILRKLGYTLLLK